MRVVKLFVVLAIVVLATSGIAFAAAGDSCNEAISVSAGTVSGSVAAGSRWYSFQSGVDKIIPINTSLPGTNFDTRLVVRGVCGGAPIAQSDGTGDRKAHVSVGTFPGQTLFIEVSKIGGSGTSFDLAIDDVTVGPCPAQVGDCFTNHGGIGCNDQCSAAPCPGCCASICAADSFCCATAWDQICADAAQASCVVVPVDLQNFEIDG